MKKVAHKRLSKMITPVVVSEQPFRMLRISGVDALGLIANVKNKLYSVAPVPKEIDHR